LPTSPKACLLLHLAASLIYRGGLLRNTALVVAERARERGIGRTLVEHAKAFTRAAGCDAVELMSGTARIGAHEFDRRLGFAVTSFRFALRPGEEPA
jgi:GNAT superfamily N-acetyltransferase